ncbi:MAG: patatin-like phospholipase family protein [Rhodomicrobium sp.]
MERPRIGLALGGGAARGLAHIGVLEALTEAGLEPQIVAGTSIGAIAGGFYAAGRLEELHSLARGLTLRQLLRYLDVNLAGSSLMTGKRLEKTLASHIGDLQIEELPKKFVAVATELGSGQEVWLTKGSLAVALRASYALPGILKPIRIGGRWLMDGALVNPVPVSAARALGAQFVIAVTFHQGQYVRSALFPVEAEAEFDAKAPAPEDPPKKSRIALVKRQLLGQRGDGAGDGAPGIPRVVLEAFNITQNWIVRSRLAGDPPDATIQVNLDGIGLFDFHKAEQAIEQGRSAVRRFLSGMRRENGALEIGTALRG